MKDYIIGVDGGNTKTDYLLYDTEGNYVDGIRSGTCSHEALKDRFEGSYRVMSENISKLLKRNNITINQIKGSAFGLAGVDVLFQKKRLEDIIQRIGFINYQVVNDGFLGIKAASPNGVGVCSINGTGTVNVGIDNSGKWVQIGGIGYVSGDEAGGSFLARRSIQAAYDQCFRFGRETKITGSVFQMYGITDKYLFGDAILTTKIDSTFLIKELFSHANNGDIVAITILETAGESMGRSTAGVINELNFFDRINIIQAGSVWAKATSPYMDTKFKEIVYKLTKKDCNFILLDLPPVLGAILWAIELANGKLPSEIIKKKILISVNEYQNSI